MLRKIEEEEEGGELQKDFAKISFCEV